MYFAKVSNRLRKVIADFINKNDPPEEVRADFYEDNLTFVIICRKISHRRF